VLTKKIATKLGIATSKAFGFLLMFVNVARARGTRNNTNIIKKALPNIQKIFVIKR
jgi:hypothetical protein